MVIRSDSKMTIQALTVDRTQLEDGGWIGVKNKELLQAVVEELQQRTAKITLEWVKDHAGEVGNEGADQEAKRGLT